MQNRALGERACWQSGATRSEAAEADKRFRPRSVASALERPAALKLRLHRLQEPRPAPDSLTGKVDHRIECRVSVTATEFKFFGHDQPSKRRPRLQFIVLGFYVRANRAATMDRLERPTRITSGSGISR